MNMLSGFTGDKRSRSPPPSSDGVDGAERFARLPSGLKAFFRLELKENLDVIKGAIEGAPVQVRRSLQ